MAQLLYPIMQVSTLGAPILLAAAIGFFQRDRWIGEATLLSGLVTWFGAKGVKQLVERGRPGATNRLSEPISAQRAVEV